MGTQCKSTSPTGNNFNVITVVEILYQFNDGAGKTWVRSGDPAHTMINQRTCCDHPLNISFRDPLPHRHTTKKNIYEDDLTQGPSMASFFFSNRPKTVASKTIATDGRGHPWLHAWRGFLTHTNAGRPWQGLLAAAGIHHQLQTTNTS